MPSNYPPSPSSTPSIQEIDLSAATFPITLTAPIVRFTNSSLVNLPQDTSPFNLDNIPDGTSVVCIQGESGATTFYNGLIYGGAATVLPIDETFVLNPFSSITFVKSTQIDSYWVCVGYAVAYTG